MIKKIRNVHVVLIVVLVLAAATLLTLLLWRNNSQDSVKTTDVAQKSETSQQSESEKTDPEAQSPKSPESSAKIVKISDWGIEFTIPTALLSTEIKYYQRQSNDTPPRTYYALTTARIQSLGDKCTSEPFGDTVILNRSALKDDRGPDNEVLNAQPIGGYYYTLGSPIAACSSFDEADNMHAPSQVEVNDRNALKQALKSLSSIK